MISQLLLPAHWFSIFSWSKRQNPHPAKPRIRTPTLLQLEDVECGAAALGIILGYYGRYVPLAELRQECGVSRDGSQPASIIKAARRYGLRAKAFKKDAAQLRQLRLPVIAFWNFSHLLVVEGFSQQTVYLNDPATGPRTVSLKEFEKNYIGVVLTMEPSNEFQTGGRQPSVLLSLLDRLKNSTGTLALTIALGFLLVIPGLALPVFSQIFVDQILVENRADWLRPLLLGMLFTTVIQAFLLSQQRRYLRQLQIKLAAEMASKFFWHMLKLPIGFYTQRFPGEIAGRVKLNEQVAQVISGSMAETAINIVMALLYLLVMFTYNWLLTAIALSLALINIVALNQVQGWLEERYMQIDKDTGKLEGLGIAGIQSIETLKASALESDYFSRWAGHLAKVINNYREIAVTYELLQVLPIFCTALTTTLVLAVGGWQIMEGQMTIGVLVAFQALLTSFQNPINQLIGFVMTLPTLAGNLMRLDDILANTVDPETQNANSKTQIAPIALTGQIELQNITFGYAQVNKPLIENFSCTIAPGQWIALVGGSGSGKSTVAKIIAGLYQPWSGDVRLDGIPRREIPRSVLSQAIALIEQEVFLFSGTIRDNLTLWDPTVTDAQLRRACMDARIQEAILAMPGGYGSELLEGGINLSGGQRQRLEIARSLVTNPKILILDEATSALDNETEQLVCENIRQRGCSCIIVAHRLSQIKDCDEIIVLDRGVVVQRGTHDQLMHRGGFYAELVHEEENSHDVH
jgi:ATP-binding cassette, subfamily C, bacterial